MNSEVEIIKKVSRVVGIESDIISSIAVSARKSYSEYYKPKKKGGKRRILHPSKEVKAIQYSLIHLVFDKLDVHDISMAYQYGKSSPVKKTVELHKDFDYSIRVDFKDFFPSIRPKDLFSTLKTSKLITEYSIDKNFQDFIRSICFYSYKGKDGLPIGAPSSPFISNIIMLELDKAMLRLTKSINTDSVITRYADDIVFSVNEKGACNLFLDGIKKLLSDFKSPKLKLNPRKTAFMSRGGKRMINGLIITPDGKVSIGRKQKRYIKKLIYDYTNGNLSSDDESYLRGYLSYILDVEENFYDRLSIKYGPVVNEIRVG